MRYESVIAFRSVLIILWSGACVIGASISGASQSTPAMEQGRIQRGQQLRRILFDTMEESYANDGIWPEHPAAKERDALHLVYIQPQPDPSGKTRDAVRQASRLAAATVVLHEAVEDFPAGVWLGYADGHLEFVATAEDLAACQRQRQWVLNPAKEPATQPAPTDDAPLTLKLLDPEGTPVTGAAVGVFVQFSPDQKGSPISPLHDQDKSPAISDERGEVRLTTTGVFLYKFSTQATTPLYILNEQRQLVGRVELGREDFGPGKVLQVRLSPTCQVHGELSSLGLVAAGKKVEWSNTILFQPGRSPMYTMNYISKSAKFAFPLPPGVYGIESYGTDCNAVFHYFQIEPGQRQLDLQLDLPADAISQLSGRPAPELKSIKGWKNGGPVKLSELRGKVVLLDFWGYWCGPCVGSMPELMKLHDEFKDKGLVIIAVHDDSVGSIAEMDPKLDKVRNESWAGWNGRDLPFLVALDGGGPMRIKYSNSTCQGATTAEYGIFSYPTTVLIGRDGNVVGQLNIRGPEGRSEIQKALDAK